MFLKNIFAFVFSLVVICESAFVDTLSKCGKDDSECHKKLITNLIENIAEHGEPEIGIPSVDPLAINDKFSILDVDLTLDGVIKGVKKCVIDKFTTNIDDGIATLELTCEVIVIKGHYKVFSKSELVKSVLGGEVHGDGKGKMKIKQFSIKIVIPFEVLKKGDDTFLSALRDKVTYTFDIRGGVTFAADNIYLGDTESSANIVKIMNENSSVLIQSFGRNIMDIAMIYIFNIVDKFFTNVSTKHFIIEDLSSYVKN